MFDNAGSQHSLLEDREACAREIDPTPAALAYRQNPTAHPEYVNQVFTDLNQCIERKGWKQVRSQQEQVCEAITSELAQTSQPVPRSDPKAIEASVRGSKRDSQVCQVRRAGGKMEVEDQVEGKFEGKGTAVTQLFRCK